MRSATSSTPRCRPTHASFHADRGRVPSSFDGGPSTMRRASSSLGPGCTCGNQPSASRPDAPVRGRRPRAEPDRDRPLHRQGRQAGGVDLVVLALERDDVGSRPEQPHAASTCSSKRRPRLRKSMPSASYSTSFHPIPTPSRNRPPVNTSTSAACLATSTVWRCGRMSTPVTSSRFVMRGEVPEQHERLVERRRRGCTGRASPCTSGRRRSRGRRRGSGRSRLFDPPRRRRAPRRGRRRSRSAGTQRRSACTVI